MTRKSTIDEEALIRTAVARLRAGILAIACGLLAGTGLFVATVWLVVQGGATVGPHLGLLRYYMPGYSVTGAGAFLGLFYGVLYGAAVGGLTGWIYNRVANSRQIRR